MFHVKHLHLINVYNNIILIIVNDYIFMSVKNITSVHFV